MKRIAITMILAAICTVSALGQIMNVKALNFVHQDAKTYQIINPVNASEKGKIKIVFTYDNEEYPEEWNTSYLIAETTREFSDIYDDTELEITNMIEVTPPKGYLPCLRKEITFYRANGDRIDRQVLTPDEPIIWNRSQAKFFTVVFISNPILEPKVELEEFYFRYRGGEGWEGNSLAQPTASKITARRVGEYFWMENNFNAWDPFTPTAFYSNYVSFTDATMANYFKTIDATDPSKWKDLYKVTVEDINRDYGYYFEPWGAYRLHLWGIFSTDQQGASLNHPNGAGTIQSQYRLPFYEDVRQLFATCPFADPNDITGTHTALNERDIRYTLGANKGLNKSAYDFYEDATTSSYWFNANNTYGLGYMPAGWRSQIANDWFYNGIPNPVTADNRWNLALGGLAQMFYTVYLPVGSKSYHGLQEDVITLAEHVNSIPNSGYRDQSPKRTPLRWMRPLTDAELGYKLYIKIPGIETSSEWIKLRDNKNEIPLLIAIRNEVINLNAITIDIQKLSHTSTAPTGYIELPKGYLRGFYVQYNIIRNEKKTANVLAKYASNVEDEVLGYRAYWQKSAIASPAVEAKAIPVVNEVSSVTLYPNPASEIVNINTASAIKSIKVIDIAGRMCIHLKAPKGNKIDISQLAKGIYFISLETANGIENHRIIKN